ncbi:MAG: site-2 protease family protein [Synergistaceae bacterium]|jgi:Zn-dependent protease|nr:site-2 protease family protein [Synergistaceae bacterium]
MGFFPSNFGSASWLADMLLRLPSVLWALSFHEFCHGWMAFKLGDRTAASQGRLSLNPMAHLDLVGTLMLVFLRFGWAKPVPINSRYFKNPRRDIALVSFAGAGGNFLTAIFFGILLNLFPALLLQSRSITTLILNFLYMNIGLGVFNLIPIPPLDGSKILAVMLPPSQMRTFFFLEQYGMVIILILVFTGILPLIMNPIIQLLLRLFLFQF